MVEKALGQKWSECKGVGADMAIPSDIGKVFFSYERCKPILRKNSFKERNDLIHAA